MQNTIERRRTRRMLVAGALALMTVAGSLVGTNAAQADAIVVGTMIGSKAEIVRGEVLTVTATVPRRVKTAVPTGTVAFYIDGNTPIDVPVNTIGKATIRTSTLALGPHAIAGTYSGDDNYLSGSVGDVFVNVIKGSTTTKVSLQRLVNPPNRRVPMIARVGRVGKARGSLAGVATFTATPVGGEPMVASLPVNSIGVAQWAPILPEGLFTVSVTFEGNDDFEPSTSADLVVPIGAVPDQVSEGPVDGSYGIALNDGAEFWVAQSFQPDITGALTKVDITVGSNSTTTPDLRVTIQPVDGAGRPTGTVLAESSVQADDVGGMSRTQLVFASPASVTAGETYAIVLQQSAPDPMFQWFAGYTPNVYPEGIVMQRLFGAWNDRSGDDMIFTTYVRAA